MTEEKPTIKEVHVWISQEIRDAQKVLLTSQEKYIHRNFIRMMKAVHGYLGQPPAPKVVTREQIQDLSDNIACSLLKPCDSYIVNDHISTFLADLGIEVKEEK